MLVLVKTMVRTKLLNPIQSCLNDSYFLRVISEHKKFIR